MVRRLLAFPLAGLIAVSSQASARDAGNMSAATVSTAARVAAGYGVITSGWRSIAHNRAVGGVPNSYHLHGAAIDVARKPGVSHRQIAAALHAAGLTLIESLDEGDHSHFAFGPVRPANSLMGSQPTAVGNAVKALPVLAADSHGILYVDLQHAGAQ
jgi:Peptidase M15